MKGGGGGMKISGDTCVASVDVVVLIVPGEGGKTSLAAERGMASALRPYCPAPEAARLSCGLDGYSFKLGGRPRCEVREGWPEFLRSFAVVGLGDILVSWLCRRARELRALAVATIIRRAVITESPRQGMATRRGAPA